jgi:hypothetical protein
MKENYLKIGIRPIIDGRKKGILIKHTKGSCSIKMYHPEIHHRRSIRLQGYYYSQAGRGGFETRPYMVKSQFTTAMRLSVLQTFFFVRTGLNEYCPDMHLRGSENPIPLSTGCRF